MTALRVTRRGALAGLAAVATVPFVRGVRAQGAAAHGLSMFGDLKYPPDFAHFDYVDPLAPKGGTFSQIASSFAYNQNPSTFNTLNMFVLRGDSPVGLESTFASLMARAWDEPDAMYGLAARAVSSEDGGRTVPWTSFSSHC